MTTIGERLKIVRGDMLQEDLADRLGVHKNTLAGYEKGKRQPDADYLNKVLEKFPNVDPAWLLTGKRVKDKGTYDPLIAEKSVPYCSTAMGSDYVLVPRYKVSASAGGGAIVQSEQIVDHLAFKADWVRNALDVSAKNLSLISVKGDSMEPTLSNGDLILIDAGTNKVEDNAIYVLRFNGTLLVKRVQRKLDGSVVIKSDNQAYDPEVVTGSAIEDLHVVGRVVWCGRRM